MKSIFKNLIYDVTVYNMNSFTNLMTKVFKISLIFLREI